MGREMIKACENGDMLVVDSYFDMFGVEHFEAGIIETVQRPVMMYRRLSDVKHSRAEAVSALSTASHGQCPTGGDGTSGGGR